MKYSYTKVIEDLNSGKIKKIVFDVKGYAHYNHCEISNIYDKLDIKRILIKPVDDNSETVAFYKTFKEDYKIFKMGRKGTFTLKQMWNDIEITEITGYKD